MIKTKLYLIFFFSITPSVCYAYVDPGIFALIWQSLIAVIFATLAYFRLFYFKTSEFIKNNLSFIKSKYFVSIFDLILLILVLLIPIILISQNNSFYYGFNDYLIAVINLVVLSTIIFVGTFIIIKIFKGNKSYTLFISIFILLFSYLTSSFEEFIIKRFLTHETIIYLRVISLIFIPLIVLYLARFLTKFKISKIRLFLSVFVIIITSISLFEFLYERKFIKGDITQNIWKYKNPEIIDINLQESIFFIFTDAYLSPKYYDILYPGKENSLFKTLKKKKFILKNNSFSSYSSSRLSIPSIFNSNIFSNELNLNSLKINYSNKDNFLDNSFLMKTLKKNQYNHKLIVCDFEYVFKKKNCKERYTYLSLIEDITIIEGIFYYNTFYRLFKKTTLFLYDQKLFRNIFDKFTKDENQEILYFLENQIKQTRKMGKSFYSIVFTKPHVPWTLNGDCSWKDIPLSQNVKNGFLIKDEALRVNGYIDNLDCINDYLINLILLIEKYYEDAIIVLISDNGPNIRPKKILDTNLQDKSLKLYDQNSSLIAFNGGSKCTKNNQLGSNFHHVNLFKIIFSCENMDSYEMLPHTTYINPIIKIDKFNFDEINLNE